MTLAYFYVVDGVTTYGTVSLVVVAGGRLLLIHPPTLDGGFGRGGVEL